jgi:multiple antibiotic resistance protein
VRYRRTRRGVMTWNRLVAATLWLAMPINRLLGTTGINIATRVMALIVASVGINFILTGIKNQLPGLV